MSIVIAVAKQGEVAIACDTQINFGNLCTDPDNYQAEKAFRWGDNLIGRTGWEKYHVVLQSFLAAREAKVLDDELEISDLFHAFWEHAKQRFGLVNYQSGKNNNPWINVDAEFLVVNASGIFLVATDLSVSRFQRFHAIGSGRDWALGAASALFPGTATAPEIARRAVEIACTFDTQCGGKVRVLTL